MRTLLTGFLTAKRLITHWQQEPIGSNQPSPALQRSLTLTDWWKLSKKSACERGHVSITPLPKNATTIGTRLHWKEWTAKTSKSRFSDLNRVPLLASPTGRRTTREHV